MTKIKPVTITPIITMSSIKYAIKYIFIGVFIAVCVSLYEWMTL